MRKLISLILALLLCAGLSVPALANDLISNRHDATVEDVNPSAPSKPGQSSTASVCTGTGSMRNFKVVNHTPARFTDVPAGHWAEASVQLCWEYGLMQGTNAANTTFDLSGQLTYAQAITMVCRVHQLYEDGKVTLQNGSPWYKPYFQYAIDHGIVAGFAKSFDELAGEMISRREMAYLFAMALPVSEYTAINSPAYIMDKDINNNLIQLPKSNSYYKYILRLYQAGITIGSGGLGTFNSLYSISRSETAAIIARVILPEMRIRTEWLDIRALEFLGADSYVAMPQGTQTMTKEDLLSYGVNPAIVAQMRDFRSWSGDLLATWMEYEPTAASDVHALGEAEHLAFVYDHVGDDAVIKNTTVSAFEDLPCLVTVCYGDMDSNGTADLNVAISVVYNGYAVHILYTDMGSDAEMGISRLSYMCGYTFLGGKGMRPLPTFQ